MSLPDFADPRIAALFACLGAILTLAWFLGGGPERKGAYTIAAMLVVQALLYSTVSEPRFDRIDAVALTADGVGLLGFTAIALNANRVWPLFAAAMELISVLAHLTQGFEVMVDQSYADFKAMPSIAALLSLLLGLIFHRIRIVRYGFDRDWVSFKQYDEYRKVLREVEQY